SRDHSLVCSRGAHRDLPSFPTRRSSDLIQAIWTAVQEQAPVTFVVLDNSRYAAVAVLGEAAGGNKLPGVELGGIDFVQLASSLGCPAKLVTTPEELDDALRAAFNGRTGPALLHVKVDPGQRFLY